MDATLLQLGAVAEDVGLSLRTIRYDEEIGLVTPSGRTTGGFRLHHAEDVDRLRLIKRMKPLGQSLEPVFVDDNPAEREVIRRLVPEVDVLPLPPPARRRCPDARRVPVVRADRAHRDGRLGRARTVAELRRFVETRAGV